jgi:hypothetical protein
VKPTGLDNSQVRSEPNKHSMDKKENEAGSETGNDRRSPLRRAKTIASPDSVSQLPKKKDEAGTETSDEPRSPFRRARSSVAGSESMS